MALIRDADGPVSVDYLCEQTRLHANTVRGHLEVLLAGGQVEREPGEAGGRGRPPWLYRPGEPESSVYSELARTLMLELRESNDPHLVEDAAHRWAHIVDSGITAESPDDAVDQAATSLRQLGFTAAVSPVGDTISLGNCPYASLVADQPVICDIHAALLTDLLERSDSEVTVAELAVWARPGVCVARLNRPDLTAARTIVPDETKSTGARRRK